MSWILEIGLPSPDLKTFLRSLKKAEKGLGSVGKASKKADKSVAEMGRSFFTAKKGIALMGVSLVAVNAIINKSLKNFAELENRMIAIGRIGQIGDDGLANLESSFRSLAVQTGITSVEIANFAEQGARFGIRGVDELKDFTTSMALLGSITGNVSVTMVKELSRIKELTDDSGVSFGNLSNAIVNLGNNFATSEGKIVRTSARIATDLSQFGVSTEFILGLGTAMDSMGISAERGGSAMQRMSAALRDAERVGGESMFAIADASGIARLELDAMIRANPSVAMIEIAKTGANAEKVMKALGLNAIRTTAVYGQLAAKSGQLKKAMDIASRSVESTTTLLRHQEVQANSLLNVQKRLNQSSKEVGTLIGASSSEQHKAYLKQLLLVSQSFNDSNKGQKEQLEGFRIGGEVIRGYTAGLSELKNGLLSIGVAAGDVALGLGGSFLQGLEFAGDLAGFTDLAEFAINSSQSVEELAKSTAKETARLKEQNAVLQKGLAIAKEAEIAKIKATRELSKQDKFLRELEIREVETAKRRKNDLKENTKLLATQLKALEELGRESGRELSLLKLTDNQASVAAVDFARQDSDRDFRDEIGKAIAAAKDIGDDETAARLLKVQFDQLSTLKEIADREKSDILAEAADSTAGEIQTFQDTRADFKTSLDKLKSGPIAPLTGAVTDEKEALDFTAQVKRQNKVDEKRFNEELKQLEKQQKELAKAREIAKESLAELQKLSGSIYSGR